MKGYEFFCCTIFYNLSYENGAVVPTVAKLTVSLASDDFEEDVSEDVSFDFEEHAASKATEAMATPVIPRIFLSFIIVSFEIDCSNCNKNH